MVGKKDIETVFLIGLFILGFVNIYLAIQTDFLGEDEAVYTSLGDKFSNFEFDAFTRTGQHTVEPPFIPLLYGGLFLVTGKSLAIAKAVSAFFGMLTLFIVYLIGKRINVYTGIFSVVMLLLISTFTHMSLLAYVDVPTAFFSALMLYIFLNMKTKKDSILLGVVMGVAYFVKVSTFFIVMLLVLYSLYLFIFFKKKEQLKLTLTSLIIVLAFLMPYIIRNLILYEYPYFIVIDMIFPVVARATGWVGPGTASSTPILTLDYFVSTFSWFALIFGIMGLVYVFFNRENSKKEIDLSTLLFLSFLAMFISLYIIGKVIAEQRYLMIVFPQLALVGGYFLARLKDYKKYAILLLSVIFVLSFYTSLSIAWSTSQTVRFPSEYVQTLEWVGKNTPEDALIFTTYGGSVSNYANRDNIWTQITEFDKVMTSDDPVFINKILKDYDVDYVVIWSGVVAESYYIPHANLAGVFSYQFVTTTLNANESFSIVYQNQNDVVLKVL